MWDYHCGNNGPKNNVNVKVEKSVNANKIHYAKTLDNIHNTDWKEWIDMHRNSNIDEVYNSFHVLFQSKIVLETKKVNRKRNTAIEL